MLNLFKLRKNYPCVLQLSEEDCGAACIVSICRQHGRFLSMNKSREAVGTGQLGTTLLGLKRGSENLGFNARAVKASPAILDRIKEIQLPAIIHWRGYHWVVLYGKKGSKYIIADPAVGIRYIHREELTAAWNGVMLLMEPDHQRFSQQPHDKPQPGFTRFLQRILPYHGLLSQVFMINIVLGVLALGSPVLIQILTDDVLVRGDTQLLAVIAIAVIIMNLFSSGMQVLESTMIAHFSQRLQLGLVLEFGRRILQLPLTYYEARRSGEITSRLRDINEINQLVSQVVVLLPSQFFIAVISFGLMLFYSWQLALAVILIGALMSLATLPLLPVLQQKTRSLLVLGSENQGVLVETFKGAQVLKTTNAAPQFWDELQNRFGRLANLTFSTIQIGIINNTIAKFLSAIGGVVLLGLGSILVIQGKLSIGQMLAINVLQVNVLTLISSLVGLVDEYFRSQTAISRLLEVIDATPEVDNTSQKPFAQISSDADIRFSHINFHHPGRVDLLEDFSLKLPGGQIIALIGKSGCGKSSLAKLMAGLYQPNSGNIRIGFYNIQDIALDCLRQQVVYVPQEPHFWSRSILENFRLGSPHISFEEVVTACQIADADSFISQLPNKYQTVLGEFGANLSGGQKQRLAIARGILNNPPVLILDEATAGLDPVSETQVLDRLLESRQGKTTILITHRPSVVHRADWIVLLDQGKIQLQGTLEDFLSQQGEHLKFLSL
ncbi:bacteriocin-processing peptidase, Cysteine peptidase, MEROPS family C39 [Trichormus variabilis ATCC 29413]|uniref:Bacteriocin-processing peptidase, Cysteine peptidase, MEROPS family C39 n=2 Tax=Anabaena variabilis TaxID=264691 RepID=Q3MFJ0_TRIV2|nr:MULTISPECIES: peptidase domain-containing ABC transporter [Nostocaceae]ABA20246.1 bacteriocin-processing peptidase, Cysteine peptidase, MEROPS family C39 [Trichormus variabilis ATCC 29413]MBC1217566.1 peptidase domain-containing ABC transporter [Trichormus variabilis ARAD]MBC1304882.1 peptidase domain-containing ABC transporter [Trichormus variabilis N2B]MBC1314422.1 peptidase domain-containing ABC transporter [Trichormus variabilis PNB]MBC1329112.1 peptidase domain-containing ABC transport